MEEERPKLLIVDDEEIEREGMAHFIPWQEQGVELVGAAWNGVQGLEMMEQFRPDIVLVDVKMPVMNGLEMIRKARQTFPDVVYVILSGYGEYEFTSQAMEEGVRHYLLKPCDEKKIVAVLDKVKAELQEKQERASKAQNARLLLPHAREQLFCELLLDHAQRGAAAVQNFMTEMGGPDRPVLLLDVQLRRGFDYLERFVVGNIMTDLLPSGTLLCSGGFDRDTFLLLDPQADAALDAAFARLQVEFRGRLGLSQTGQTLPAAYRQLKDYENVGLTMTIPIYDWGMGRGKVRMAKTDVEITKTQIEQANTEFAHDVRTRVMQFNNQAEQCRTSLRAQDIAAERYDIMKRRFENGAVTVTELNTAQEEYESAQHLYISQLQQFWTDYYGIQKLTLYDFIRNEDIRVNFNDLVK